MRLRTKGALVLSLLQKSGLIDELTATPSSGLLLNQESLKMLNGCLFPLLHLRFEESDVLLSWLPLSESELIQNKRHYLQVSTQIMLAATCETRQAQITLHMYCPCMISNKLLNCWFSGCLSMKGNSSPLLSHSSTVRAWKEQIPSPVPFHLNKF